MQLNILNGNNFDYIFPQERNDSRKWMALTETFSPLNKSFWIDRIFPSDFSSREHCKGALAFSIVDKKISLIVTCKC